MYLSLLDVIKFVQQTTLFSMDNQISPANIFLLSIKIYTEKNVFLLNKPIFFVSAPRNDV